MRNWQPYMMSFEEVWSQQPYVMLCEVNSHMWCGKSAPIVLPYAELTAIYDVLWSSLKSAAIYVNAWSRQPYVRCEIGTHSACAFVCTCECVCVLKYLWGSPCQRILHKAHGHIRACVRMLVLKYLKDHHVKGSHTDTNWTVSKMDRKSTIGYCTSVN